MPTTTSINTIQKLYIAYYARPADPTGLNYWANALDSNSTGINAIVDTFASSTEAQSLYGSATSVADRITVLYQNILGRTPDAPGLAYYQGEVEAGRLSLGKAAIALLEGAQTSGETAVINNRLELAQKFTQHIDANATPYTGTAAAAVGRTFLKNVLGTTDSLAQGNGKLAAYLNTTKVASQVPDKFGSIVHNGFLSNTNVVSESLTTTNIDTFLSGSGADATAPILVSATVSDATLVLLYNEALDTQNPASSGSFTVKVGGQTVALAANNPVTVDGDRKVVTLKLASAVAQGSTVTVSYADPTTGNDVKATQDKAGNDAASFSNTSVSHSAVNFVSNVKDASATNQDTSVESAARHIGSAVLFVGSDGTWSLGIPGQKISEYQKVKINGVGNVHDDTQEKTALIAEAREGGGYVLYLQSNADAREFFQAHADAQGNITTGFTLLTTEELFATEKKYGVDLNGNGGLGADKVLADTGKTDLYLDGLGAYQLKKADGSFLALVYEGEPLTEEILDGYGIQSVVPDADGGYQLYLSDDEGDLFEMSADETGTIETETIGTITTGQGSIRAGQNSPMNLSDAETKTGEDLNRAGDTVVTQGWTTALQNSDIRAEVDTQTANGAKINHAGLVKIVDIALQAAGSNPIGNEIFSDLKAIAARGKGLFTSQDVSGADIGYLQYTFDQMVNGSKANNFYTGGTTKPESLGNLSPTASADTLKKLENKWLLGKDLPNPTTEGDTANPNAAAASGSYKAFTGELINGAAAADVNQGSAGTCYLLASMAAIAQVNPSAINQMFATNGTGADGLQTWGVRFYDTKGQTHWVTVNNQLVVRTAEDTNAAYAKAKGVDGQGKATQEMWGPLLEKAYAQANELEIFARSNQKNSMFAIEGGLAEAVVNLAGGKITTFADRVIRYNGNDILKTSVVPEGSTALAEYTKALNSGKAVFIVSQTKTATADGSTLFTSGHAYMAYDADLTNPSNTTVKVYNPWGVSLPTDTTPTPSHITPFDGDLVTLVGTTGIEFWVGV